jgi:vancomycin resistance protein YoaR
MKEKNQNSAGHPADNTVTATKSFGDKLKSHWKLLLVIGIAVIVVAAAATALILHFQNEYNKKVSAAVNVSTFYEGIYVNDVDLSGKTMEEAKELMKAVEDSLRPTIALTLTYGEQKFDFTDQDFQFSYDTDKILEEAYQVARKGTDRERYQEILALKENPKKFTITCTPDYSNVPNLVSSVAEQIDKAPVDAHVSSFNPSSDNMFTYADGEKGVKVNQETMCQKMLEALETNQGGTIELVTEELPFTVTKEEISQNTKLISTYQTISTNGANGNSNIRLALSHINGKEIKPGETLSFLKSVGNPGDPRQGWKKAGVISKGKMIQDYGGGICQAATTLYGAALRADLTIVRRGNHSWPSVYEQIGQDAAVSYPGQDLQIKNDSDSSMFIWAGMIGNKVTVRIYGKQPSEWDTIKVFSSKTGSITPEATIYKDDPSLPKGTEKVDVQSRTGYTASAYRVFYKNGAEVRRENLPNSYYRPIQGVILRGTKETAPPAESQPESSVPESQPESSEASVQETE